MKTFQAGVLLYILHFISSLDLESNEVVDYRLKTHITFANEKCNATGLMCRNCRELLYCRSNASGGWVEEPYQTCPHGQVCVDNRCTSVPSPKCSPTDHLDFLCGSSGMFPNPGDCRKYHFCIPDIENPSFLTESAAKCDFDGNPGWGYNPRTNFCDVKLPDSRCDGYPIPLCKNIGDVAPLSKNPSLYYTCALHPDDRSVLYPFQNACPNGKIFEVDLGCVDSVPAVTQTVFD